MGDSNDAHGHFVLLYQSTHCEEDVSGDSTHMAMSISPAMEGRMLSCTFLDVCPVSATNICVVQAVKAARARTAPSPKELIRKRTVGAAN
jgi:hypothetical protein